MAPIATTSYTVTVTDGVGCTATSLPHELEVRTPPRVVVLLNCVDGEFVLSALAFQGAPPYAYRWSNGATSPSITAGPGNWDVTVTDADGCTTVAGRLVLPGECVPLREVSGPGAPPLRVTRNGPFELVRFEKLPFVPFYNLHAGPLGNWIQHAGNPDRRCRVAAFNDRGDGTAAECRRCCAPTRRSW